MNKKYLYKRNISTIFRYEILKENDRFFWIRVGTGETRISKKTMRPGKSFKWDSSYYVETDNLRDDYERQQKIFYYKKKLELLNNCIDDDVINSVLEINIPGEV